MIIACFTICLGILDTISLLQLEFSQNEMNTNHCLCNPWRARELPGGGGVGENIRDLQNCIETMKLCPFLIKNYIGL